MFNFEDLDIEVVQSDWTKLYSTKLDFEDISLKFSCNDLDMVKKMNTFYGLGSRKRYDGELIYIVRDTGDRSHLAPYDEEEHRLVVEGTSDFGYAKSLLFGVLGDIQQKEEKYALHAGIVGGIAYIGPTGAGKTTHSILEAKKEEPLLTDDWSYFKGNVAHRVESNIMIPKRIRDLLGVDLTFDEGNFSGRTKYMFKIEDLFKNNNKCQEVNNFILLVPKILSDNIQEVNKDLFVDYSIRSTYHLPFNYFDSDKGQDTETTKQRRVFWREVYDGAENVFAVSTRNLDFIKTHELIEGKIK